MGLTGGTKTSVFSSAFPLWEPDTIKISDYLLYALFSGASITDVIIDMNIERTALTYKMNRMREYAKSTYTLGLPDSFFSASQILENSLVASAITEDTGAVNGVEVDFNYVNPLCFHHIVIPHLLSVRDWDPSSNRICSYPEGMLTPVHPTLTTAIIISIGSLALDDTGTKIRITYVNNSLVLKDSDSIGTYYDPLSLSDEEKYFTEEYDIPTGLRFDKDYCIAGYRVLDALGAPGDQLHWWFYDVASELYPSLNKEATIDGSNNLLPVIPIRYDNQSLTNTEAQSTDLYQTSKTLLNKVNVDIDQLGSLIDDNPDVAEIDHAYAMFGINLQTEHNTSIRYLTEFFDYLADRSSISILDSIGHILGTSNVEGDPSAGSFIDVTDKPYIPQNRYDMGFFSDRIPSLTTSTHSWQDSNGETIDLSIVNDATTVDFKEHGLDISLTYSYIRSDILVGSIGSVGTATMDKEKVDRQSTILSLGENDREAVSSWDESLLTLKLQISSNTYKRVQIKGLIHRNKIYREMDVRTTLSDIIDDPENNNLIIPLHYGVASSSIPLRLRSSLYEDSFVMVLNSIVRTKLAWYETNFFRVFTMIITYAIAAWSGQYWLAELSAQLAAGYMAALAFVAQSIAVSIVVTYAFKMLAGVIGPELTALLAVVVMAVSISKFQGATILSSITKETLMKVSVCIAKGAEAEVNSQLEEFGQEYDKFLIDSEAKMEKLEEAQKLLESPDMLPFDLVHASAPRYRETTPNLSPSDYYKTKLCPNIHVLSLQGPTVFYDLSLQLPKPDPPAFAF